MMLCVQNLLAQTPQFVIHQQGIGPSSRLSTGKSVCSVKMKILQTSSVSTLQLSGNILSLALNDVVMRVRLANVGDLVAAEGK